MIKTFRGLLLDDEQEKIRLSTKKGKIGYKIKLFELMPNNGAAHKNESTVKVYKVEQTSVDSTVDFSDGNLLAAGYLENRDNDAYMGGMIITIFDQEIFNQDIYNTHKDDGGENRKINYYLELEVMPLTDNAAVVSTLRDIRLNPQVGA